MRSLIQLKVRSHRLTSRKPTEYTTLSGTHWKADANIFLESIRALSIEEMAGTIELAAWRRRST